MTAAPALLFSEVCMIEFLSLLLMSAVSILGLGAAINFFAQTGFRRGCGP